MLFVYSLGLRQFPSCSGAVLIDRLKSAFGWIKRHYRIINLVCGSLLVLVGILMAHRHAGPPDHPVKLIKETS